MQPQQSFDQNVWQETCERIAHAVHKKYGPDQAQFSDKYRNAVALALNNVPTEQLEEAILIAHEIEKITLTEANDEQSLTKNGVIIRSIMNEHRPLA